MSVQAAVNEACQAVFEATKALLPQGAHGEVHIFVNAELTITQPDGSRSSQSVQATQKWPQRDAWDEGYKAGQDSVREFIQPVVERVIKGASQE
jgi:hypothetical protein